MADPLVQTPDDVAQYLDYIRRLSMPGGVMAQDQPAFAQGGFPSPQPPPEQIPAASTPTQQKQLPPQSTGNYGPPPAYSVPSAPHLQSVPAPPQTPEANPFEVFKNPVVALSIIGSLFTRRPLVAAMGAAGSAMNAQRQNQQDQFNQNKERFHDQLEQAVAQNRIELEKYQVALDRSKTENWNKVLPGMWAEAAAHDDKFMMQLLRLGPEAAEKGILHRSQLQDTLNSAIERAKAVQEVRNQGPPIGNDTIDFLARQALSGNQRMLMGWFRFPQVRLQIESRMQDILADQGVEGQAAADQIARNTAQISALNQGAGVLGRREAMVTAAILTAQQTGPRVLQALAGVDRTQFTDLNRLIRAGETRSGSPDEVRLGIAVNTFINNYARASSSITGQTTDTARREATDLLQPWWAKGQIEAGIDQMLNYELPSELEAAQKSVKTFTEGFHTGGAKGGADTGAQGLTKVKTPEEAQKLPPGTHYLTPDGHEYVR